MERVKLSKGFKNANGNQKRLFSESKKCREPKKPSKNKSMDYSQTYAKSTNSTAPESRKSIKI